MKLLETTCSSEVRCLEVEEAEVWFEYRQASREHNRPDRMGFKDGAKRWHKRDSCVEPPPTPRSCSCTVNVSSGWCAMVRVSPGRKLLERRIRAAKEGIDLLSVAQDLTTLRKKGERWRGKCPICDNGAHSDAFSLDDNSGTLALLRVRLRRGPRASGGALGRRSACRKP